MFRAHDMNLPRNFQHRHFREEEISNSSPIVLSLLHRRNVAVKMPQSHALTYSAYYQLEDTPND